MARPGLMEANIPRGRAVTGMGLSVAGQLMGREKQGSITGAEVG